jgi:hypothetical protein
MPSVRRTFVGVPRGLKPERVAVETLLAAASGWEATAMKTVVATRSARPLAWDAILGAALLAVATMLGLAAITAFVPIVGAPDRAIGRVVLGSIAAASVFSVRVLGSWPSAKTHGRGALLAASLMGMSAVFVAGILLSPWPELSDEVLRRGQLRFVLEGAKTLIPWATGTVVACGVLRLDPPIRARC